MAPFHGITKCPTRLNRSLRRCSSQAPLQPVLCIVRVLPSAYQATAELWRQGMRRPQASSAMHSLSVKTKLQGRCSRRSIFSGRAPTRRCEHFPMEVCSHLFMRQIRIWLKCASPVRRSRRAFGPFRKSCPGRASFFVEISRAPVPNLACSERAQLTQTTQSSWPWRLIRIVVQSITKQCRQSPFPRLTGKQALSEMASKQKLSPFLGPRTIALCPLFVHVCLFKRPCLG